MCVSFPHSSFPFQSVSFLEFSFKFALINISSPLFFVFVPFHFHGNFPSLSFYELFIFLHHFFFLFLPHELAIISFPSSFLSFSVQFSFLNLSTFHSTPHSLHFLTHYYTLKASKTSSSRPLLFLTFSPSFQPLTPHTVHFLLSFLPWGSPEGL